VAEVTYTLTLTQREFDRTLAAIRAYEMLLDGYNDTANILHEVEIVATNEDLHEEPTAAEVGAIGDKINQ